VVDLIENLTKAMPKTANVSYGLMAYGAHSKVGEYQKIAYGSFRNMLITTQRVLVTNQ
jgi:hypothetical protein